MSILSRVFAAAEWEYERLYCVVEGTGTKGMNAAIKNTPKVAFCVLCQESVNYMVVERSTEMI